MTSSLKKQDKTLVLNLLNFVGKFVKFKYLLWSLIGLSIVILAFMAIPYFYLDYYVDSYWFVTMLETAINILAVLLVGMVVWKSSKRILLKIKTYYIELGVSDYWKKIFLVLDQSKAIILFGLLVLNLSRVFVVLNKGSSYSIRALVADIGSDLLIFAAVLVVLVSAFYVVSKPANSYEKKLIIT